MTDRLKEHLSNRNSLVAFLLFRSVDDQKKRSIQQNRMQHKVTISTDTKFSCQTGESYGTCRAAACRALSSALAPVQSPTRAQGGPPANIHPDLCARSQLRLACPCPFFSAIPPQQPGRMWISRRWFIWRHVVRQRGYSRCKISPLDISRYFHHLVPCIVFEFLYPDPIYPGSRKVHGSTIYDGRRIQNYKVRRRVNDADSCKPLMPI